MTPRLHCAAAWPWSAAAWQSCTARASFLATPRPVAYMLPRAHCALASPWSAAAWRVSTFMMPRCRYASPPTPRRESRDWLLVWLLVASADQSAAHLCARRAGASHAAAGRGVPLSVCVYNRVHTRPQNGPTRALRCGRMCGGACGDGCARAEGGEEEQRHRGRHAVALEIRVCSRSRVVGDFLITSRGSEYEYCFQAPDSPPPALPAFHPRAPHLPSFSRHAASPRPPTPHSCESCRHWHTRGRPDDPLGASSSTKNQR